MKPLTELTELSASRATSIWAHVTALSARKEGPVVHSISRVLPHRKGENCASLRAVLGGS
jgi:hypothetical protein